MTLRLATPSADHQFEEWARILFTVSGDRVSVDELRHTATSEPDSFWLLAYEDGKAVGTAFARRASVADARYTMVRVAPEHRRRGVGSALLEALVDDVRAHHCGTMFGRVREDDPASIGFLEKRGFTEFSRERPVALDVTRAGAEPPVLPNGIEIVSLADRADLARAAYDLDLEAARDIPVPVELDPVGFDVWRAQTLEGPGAMPHACLLALHGDEVIGYAGLRRLDREDAENLMTGVRRAWRRRGIATALKCAQIARARAAGINRIHTTNDEPNAAIRGVNARLGYEPLPVMLIMRRRIRSAA